MCEKKILQNVQKDLENQRSELAAVPPLSANTKCCSVRLSAFCEATFFSLLMLPPISLFTGLNTEPSRSDSNVQYTHAGITVFKEPTENRNKLRCSIQKFVRRNLAAFNERRCFPSQNHFREEGGTHFISAAAAAALIGLTRPSTNR